MLQILKQRTVFGEGSQLYGEGSQLYGEGSQLYGESSQLYADEFPVEVARSRETLKRSM